MIDVKQVPQVAVEFMNHDHAEAAQQIQELTTALEAGDKASVIRLLQALLHHCQHHFAHEEQQMRHFQFPPYPVHKGEHEQVLAQMAAQIDGWRNGADEASLQDYIRQTLPYWFINHIGTMDMVTAQFIAAHGGPTE